MFALFQNGQFLQCVVRFNLATFWVNTTNPFFPNMRGYIKTTNKPVFKILRHVLGNRGIITRGTSQIIVCSHASFTQIICYFKIVLAFGNLVDPMYFFFLV